MRNTFYQRNKKYSILTKTAGFVVSAALIIGMATPGTAYALRGDSGYEGGISSGENPNVTVTLTTSKISYQYQEPFFLTGVPIVLTGTMTVNKKLNTDSKTGVQTLTTTYDYNVPNSNNNSLVRKIVMTTTITPRDNGQKTETTKLTSASETLKLNGVSYYISKSNPNDYMISKAITNDYQPAVSYFAGTLIGKKTYHVGSSTSPNTIVVDSTCNTVGYDEYWSTAETQIIKQTITSRKGGQAAIVLGNANIDISTTTTKQLKYYENQPEQISFEGGYYKTQYNENVLKYTANLKELDKNGVPTSKTVTYTRSLKLESFPFNDPLVAPNLKKIKGHPAEESMAIMFGLEAYKNIDSFNPQEYMSRGEFIDAFSKVAPAVPLDPVFKPKTTKSSSRKKAPVVLLFKDVPEKNKYFSSINDAANRGIVSTGGNFRPDAKITLAEAVTMMINSLGLKGLAPNPSPVTRFKDNDKIPGYARAPMYVAEKIGLIQEDSRGYIYPTAKITKANAARIMKVYIEYMNSGIRKEYMERIISYK
ncbi:S-layer homology domain-containing protein [Ruminiclostridium cellulolyticum]|uniref:S-layer domain protein n=1 Tax=Ruminiclostridium cellulolyticum (strain ATCC 35319 / DSM 5812 / JCM 6584 / H10) TaxID=394503 RepID=B8I596_RUMCH|nr:S-layer homology domain-containing protein [Ruminiclostridium cellulolyticum]ACL74676.1 S-layer domain protein [Ruminiclostridium cellulolyticum H10]